MKISLLLYMILLPFLCSGQFVQLNLTLEETTVSGFGSGAFFASQFHVAFSEYVCAVTLFEGGPWWCTQGGTQMKACNTGEGLSKNALIRKANIESTRGRIDNLSNLKKSKVLLFSGSYDSAVQTDVTKVAQ